MEKILIVAAIVFFAIVIVKNLLDRKKGDPGFPYGNPSNPPRDKFGETSRFSEWTVLVLDEAGNILKQTSMSATAENPFSIGYDKDCDLKLDSEHVSRVHLKVGKDDKGYFAVDSSLNGTFVGDKEYKKESFPLEEGLVYVADVPIYFQKHTRKRDNIVPKHLTDDVKSASVADNDDQDMSSTKNFSIIKPHKINKDGPAAKSPISR